MFLALGLLTPLGSAAVIGVMFNAVVAVHWHSGEWAANGGYELPLLFGIVAVTLGFTGPGRLSFDRGLGGLGGAEGSFGQRSGCNSGLFRLKGTVRGR